MQRPDNGTEAVSVAVGTVRASVTLGNYGQSSDSAAKL